MIIGYFKYTSAFHNFICKIYVNNSILNFYLKITPFFLYFLSSEDLISHNETFFLVFGLFYPCYLLFIIFFLKIIFILSLKLTFFFNWISFFFERPILSSYIKSISLSFFFNFHSIAPWDLSLRASFKILWLSFFRYFYDF